MNVLTLSPDGHELRSTDSALARRFAEYGELVDRFDVVYPDSADRITRLTEHVTLYGIGATSKADYLLKLIARTRSFHATNRYDVLSTPDPYFLGGIAWLLGRALNIGVELQIHGFEKWSGIRPWLAQWNARHATHVRVVSERLARQLVEAFRLSRDRISVFPIFIDPARFASIASNRSPRAHSPFTFITVSRLVPVKRIELQLQALAEVRKHHDARLVIVGDGPLRASLAQQADSLGLSSAVEFCGAQPDIPPFLAQADAFILTSHAEGYGIAPIEAACSGLPVIMTDVGCANEVIIDQVHGLILPVDVTETALVAAMIRLIEHPELRTQLSRDASTIAQTLPTREELWRRYVESWERARRT